MTNREESRTVDRRAFLRQMAIGGAAAAIGCSRAGLAGGTAAAALPLRDRIGLQLFTVRDLTATDYKGTLERVAQLGYRMVQTTGSYGTNTPQQIHEWLQNAKLVSPATHVSPRMGPDFERTLEGYRLIGHEYTTVSFGPPGPRRPPADAATTQPTQAQPRGTTLDSAKRTAEQLNAAGAITKKHGLKVIVHNHTEEFEPLSDSSQRPWDVLIAETDPSLVAMELDIGWASVAGQNALDLFRSAPGRFEVWHVKDIANLSSFDKTTPMQIRRRSAKIVALGEGEIDYKAIFAQAGLAGMKYFFVEQDSAPASGNSLNEAGKSYRHLAKVLA
jgi:sugar phosphate isomerase/epimerase